MLIVGVDEAGRGPLAGPVIAAAVIFKPNDIPLGLNDSKKLSEKKREILYYEIVNRAAYFSIAEITSVQIDQINILRASRLAMKTCVLSIVKKTPIDLVLIDGNQTLGSDLMLSQKAIIKGDTLIQEIMAASILAKVHRDRLMKKFEDEYPGYGFVKHKGYGTQMHLEALKRLGPCPIHRLTFRGVVQGEQSAR
jgi:ribonuclease HII